MVGVADDLSEIVEDRAVFADVGAFTAGVAQFIFYNMALLRLTADSGIFAGLYAFPAAEAIF